MNAFEAADLIEAIADSLDRDPDQFASDLRVYVIGRSTSKPGPLSGADITGGKAKIESRPPELPASKDSPDAEMARAATKTAAKASARQSAEYLRGMVRELRAPNPDGAKLEALFQLIKRSCFPDVVISVVARLLSPWLQSGRCPETDISEK